MFLGKSSGGFGRAGPFLIYQPFPVNQKPTVMRLWFERVNNSKNHLPRIKASQSIAVFLKPKKGPGLVFSLHGWP